MTDLTKITTPYGLLDTATREALKAHGGPFEYAAPENDWRWVSVFDERPLWRRQNVYRVKPQPPKPREAWIEVDAQGRFVRFYEENPQFISTGHRCTLWRDTAS